MDFLVGIKSKQTFLSDLKISACVWTPTPKLYKGLERVFFGVRFLKVWLNLFSSIKPCDPKCFQIIVQCRFLWPKMSRGQCSVAATFVERITARLSVVSENVWFQIKVAEFVIYFLLTGGICWRSALTNRLYAGEAFRETDVSHISTPKAWETEQSGLQTKPQELALITPLMYILIRLTRRAQ